MRRAIFLPIFLIATWASGSEPVAQGWQCVGNQDLTEAIEALVGPDAVDCGFYQMGRKLDSAVQRRAYECVRRAVRARKPFKFGTVRIPVDSAVTEILARSADGKLWFVVYDFMFDEGATQWNATCDSAGVDRESLYVDSEHCEKHSVGPLMKP